MVTKQQKPYLQLIMLGLLAVAMLGILPVAGFFGAGRLGAQFFGGRGGDWEALPAVPGGAAALLGADIDLSPGSWRVFVESDDGQVYQWPRYCEENCWEVSEWPQPLYAEDPCIVPIDFDLPTPPGEIVDRTYAEACHFEGAAYRTEFVVLGDGSLWYWQYAATAGLAVLFGGLMGGLLGAGLGLLCGVVIAIVLVVLMIRRWRS